MITMRHKKLFHKTVRKLESRDIGWKYNHRKPAGNSDRDSYSCIFSMDGEAYRASLLRETWFIDGKDDEIYTLSISSGGKVNDWHGQWPRALYRFIEKRSKE